MWESEKTISIRGDFDKVFFMCLQCILTLKRPMSLVNESFRIRKESLLTGELLANFAGDEFLDVALTRGNGDEVFVRVKYYIPGNIGAFMTAYGICLMMRNRYIYNLQLLAQATPLKDAVQKSNKTLDREFKIFISHSSNDDYFCKVIYDAIKLVMPETDVFLDSSSLDAGDEWFKRIQTEVLNRPIFIIILSPEAISSRWVAEEMTVAFRETNKNPKRYIIPLLYKPCQVEEHFPFLLNRQIFDCTSTEKEGTELLIKRLQEIKRTY